MKIDVKFGLVLSSGLMKYLPTASDSVGNKMQKYRMDSVPLLFDHSERSFNLVHICLLRCLLLHPLVSLFS